VTIDPTNGDPDPFPGRWPPNDPAIRDALLAAWESGDWGRYEGRAGAEFARKLAAFHHAPHVHPCASGTIGVELALRGLAVRAGDEVVLAGYDFPGNFRAIEAIGARPVLVDLEPDRWTIDAESFEKAVSSGPVRACVVSHLHGTLADMTTICHIASRHGVGVVEDACQAVGATVQGKPAGTWGDVGVLSFGGSKLLTAGRGGALLIRDASVLQRTVIFGERGNQAFPLSELQAAVLLPQLARLAERHADRLDRARVWRERLTMEDGPFDVPPFERGSPAFYKLGLRSRAPAVEVLEKLAARRAIDRPIDIGAGFRGFHRRGAARCRRVGGLPGCERAASHTLLIHHTALAGPITGCADEADRLTHALRG